MKFEADQNSRGWPNWRLRFLLNKRRSVEELERLATAKEVSFVPMESVGEFGGLTLNTICSKDDVSTGYTLFFDEDVLVAKITPCFENSKGSVVAGLHNGVGFGTTELHVLDPTEKLNPRFLFYLTLSRDFRVFGEASMKGAAGQKRVPDEFIKDFKFHLPNLDEQVSIADYLDRETGRIDRLVSEKSLMLSLLEEKRLSLISRSVTRGLDKTVATKPSCEEWLGDIPAHWNVPRAKSLFREVDIRSENGEETLLSLRIGAGLVPHNEVSAKSLEPSDVIGFKKVAPGQMVINRMRAASGLIAVATEPGLVSPDYAVFEVIDQELCIEYFLELFKTELLQAVFRSASRGIGTGEQGFLRLYTENFLALHFPYPPPTEQRAIISFIDRERAEMAVMKSLLNQSITLASERRAALITAAVTGQVSAEEVAR